MADSRADEQASRLGEVARLFLKLGCIGFGGPAANIALMRDEVVRRRHWVSEQQFLDLLGASNLIPGPTSTEMAIYLGYARVGRLGLVIAGVLYLLPATLLAMAFAWAYVTFGGTPPWDALLYGIKPVIIAVILRAIYALGRTAVNSIAALLVLVASIALYFGGVNPLVSLLGLPVLLAMFRNRAKLHFQHLVFATPLIAQTSVEPSGFSLGVLFLTFLKIGATLYGSGYVLLAFLKDDFVTRLGWLTDQQILDAIAVGQFTPGPVFTTATFIGYLLDGFRGAVVATLAIFLPSFVCVALVYPIVPRLRASPWASAFLDGANAAAVGLMAAVAWQLTVASIVDVTTALIAIVAAVLTFRFNLNSAWLVLAGGLVGFTLRVLVSRS